MASSSAALLAVIVVAGCAGMAAAVSYTVGDAKGWVTGVDYSGWTSGKSFAVGDQLVFSYASKLHTVTEVTQGGYTSCSGSNALANDDSGATTVTLNTPGTHYYICNIQGHCASGMKLAVTVAGGGSSPGGSTPSGASAGGSLVPAMGPVVAGGGSSPGGSTPSGASAGGSLVPAMGSSPGGSTPSGASAGGSLVPAMGPVVAAAAGALLKVALF